MKVMSEEIRKATGDEERGDGKNQRRVKNQRREIEYGKR